MRSLSRRKIDTQVLTHMEEYQKTYTFKKWLKLMSQIDDDQTQRIVGTDAAMYLIFLKYTSYFFGANAILNILFIIIFVTGTPLDEDNYRTHKNMFAMQSLTILNITAVDWKVMICFLNALITVPAMMMNLSVSYSKMYQDKEDDGEDGIGIDRKLTEIDIKNCTLMVSGLKKEMSRIS